MNTKKLAIGAGVTAMMVLGAFAAGTVSRSVTSAQSVASKPVIQQMAASKAVSDQAIAAQKSTLIQPSAPQSIQNAPAQQSAPTATPGASQPVAEPTQVPGTPEPTEVAGTPEPTEVPGVAEPTEVAGPDTDNVQEQVGDQSGSDAGALTYLRPEQVDRTPTMYKKVIRQAPIATEEQRLPSHAGHAET